MHEIIKSICEDETLYIRAKDIMDCHPKELPHYEFLKSELGKYIDSPLSELALINISLNFYDFDIVGSDRISIDLLKDILREIPTNRIVDIAKYYTDLFRKGFEIKDDEVIAYERESMTLNTLESLIASFISLAYEIEYHKILQKIVLIPRDKWYKLYEIDVSDPDKVEDFEFNLSKLVPKEY